MYYSRPRRSRSPATSPSRAVACSRTRTPSPAAPPRPSTWSSAVPPRSRPAARSTWRSAAGSGAGGSVKLVVHGALSGAGLVRADGGASPDTGTGGGGGGRIALSYDALAGFDPLTQLSAIGGNTSTPGGAGTIFYQRTAD